MDGFGDAFQDFPDYIIKITHEIWEGRGIAALDRYYAPDIPLRTPMGVSLGNQAVKASTMATCHEFPDRALFAEDVIWSEDAEHGLLSSHRVITTGTHSGDGAFGRASGKRFTIRVIADCAAQNGVINDEWLVRDYGGLARQLGHDPKQFAADLIAAEGGAAKATRPFTPGADVPGPYQGSGNDNPWGARYAEILEAIMRADFAALRQSCDRAVIGEYPGAETALGVDAVVAFWIGLRASFPAAEFQIHHQIGMDADNLPPRAAIRWSLHGRHDGWGRFGPPTGAEVHVMGISHAEFGPYGPDCVGLGLRRETALFDEIAIWKQIHLGGA